MYCGHCAPCPKGIDVATVTKYRNLARAQGEVPETVRGHYDALAHTAGECIACGACEKRCPFGVGVIENMIASQTIPAFFPDCHAGSRLFPEKLTDFSSFPQADPV